MSAFVVLIADLSPDDGMPTRWREHGRYGSEPAAVRAAGEARSNDRVARIFHETAYELGALLGGTQAADDAPSDLFAAATVDSLGGHMVVTGDWLPSREQAQAQADALGNAVVVVAGAAGPRGRSR